MKTIKEKVFSVRQVRDQGTEPVLAYFDNIQGARDLEATVGGYGGRIEEVLLEFKIYDSFNEYMTEKTPELKKSALSKLTKEEKMALGL